MEMDTSNRPLARNTRLCTAPLWPLSVATGSPVSVRQTVIVPVREAAASSAASGEKVSSVALSAGCQIVSNGCAAVDATVVGYDGGGGGAWAAAPPWRTVSRVAAQASRTDTRASVQRKRRECLPPWGLGTP